MKNTRTLSICAATTETVSWTTRISSTIKACETQIVKLVPPMQVLVILKIRFSMVELVKDTGIASKSGIISLLVEISDENFKEKLMTISPLHL